MIADILCILYSDMTEEHAKKLLERVAKITGIEGITFSAMRKTLYAYSCICEKVIKLVECQTCHNWFCTNRVLCPECSKKLRSGDDFSQILLYSCKSSNCLGNIKLLSTKSVNEKKAACCLHRTRSVMGRYVLFVPPEAIIAEFISEGLEQSMFGLEEDEIVATVKQADVLGSHHILFSENALAIYKEMGWIKAEEAVRQHLDHMKESNPLSSLRNMVKEAKAIEEKKRSCIHYKK